MSFWKSWYKNFIVYLCALCILAPIIYLVVTNQVGNPVNTERVALVDEEEPLGVYSQPLKLTVGQMVSATKYVQGESAADNVIYDALKDIVNIEVESQFSAMIGDAYSYQLGMAAVSNELPDLFYCTQNELNDLIDQGMVEDLTDAYYQYASPALRLAVEYGYTGDISLWNDGNPIGLERSDSVLNIVSKNGRIYGFPFLADLFNECPLVWIRTDWLKKYAENKGISYGDISEVMPNNFQEYLDIVYYFSEANLFNGEKSYGVGFGFDGAGLQGISNVFGAYPEKFVYDENGQIVYGTTSGEFRSAMELYNQLYRDGCIDANSALDGQLLKTALAVGKIGTFIGEYWHIQWGVGDSVINNPECDWLPWAIRDYEGNVIEPMVPTNVLGASCYAMRKGYGNPEAVFIIANHLVDRFYSNDGAWTKRMVEIRTDEKYRAVRDEVEMYSPVRLDAPNKNTYYAFQIQEALATGNTDQLSLDAKEVYDTVKQYVDDPRGTGKAYYSLYKIFGPTGAYRELMHYADYDYETDPYLLKVHFKRPAYEGMYTDSMLEYMGVITEYIGLELVNLYTGSERISDTRWNNFNVNIEQKGMTEVLESLNQLKREE